MLVIITFLIDADLIIKLGLPCYTFRTYFTNQ